MQAECKETDSDVIYIDMQKDKELSRKALYHVAIDYFKVSAKWRKIANNAENCAWRKVEIMRMDKLIKVFADTQEFCKTDPVLKEAVS